MFGLFLANQPQPEDVLFVQISDFFPAVYLRAMNLVFRRELIYRLVAL